MDNIEKIENIEKKLTTGDIVCVSGNQLLPDLIQYGTDSDINHVGIIVKINNSIYVCESDIHGVNFNPFHKYFVDSDKYNYIEVKRCPLVKSKNKDFLTNMCILEAGKARYDFVLLGKNFIDKLFIKVFKKPSPVKAENRRRKSKRFICSEWVGYVLYKTLHICLDWFKLTPKDIANLPNLKLIDKINLYKND